MIKELFIVDMKGISPLMAGVLMIAFTLAVAAIVGSWLTLISRTETAEIETGFRRTINCSKGVIDIVDVTCDSNGNVDIVINNVGAIDLTDGFSTYAIDTADNTSTNVSATTSSLPRGSMMKMEDSVKVTINGTLDKVRVTSMSCPSVWAEKTSIGDSCS